MGTRDWLISFPLQFGTETLEPKEVFPCKPPDVTIKRKYRHIFALDNQTRNLGFGLDATHTPTDTPAYVRESPPLALHFRWSILTE
jgi:hypothetical protein